MNSVIPSEITKVVFTQVDKGKYTAPDGSTVVYLIPDGEQLGEWHLFDPAGTAISSEATLAELAENHDFAFVEKQDGVFGEGIDPATNDFVDEDEMPKERYQPYWRKR